MTNDLSTIAGLSIALITLAAALICLASRAWPSRNSRKDKT